MSNLGFKSFYFSGLEEIVDRQILANEQFTPNPQGGGNNR
jgi:hypothetical protein